MFPMKLRLMLAIAIGIVSTASAADESVNKRGFGAGNDSCGKWISERKTEADWLYEGQWILGYVSAFAFIKQVTLRQTDPHAIVAWMDSYCENHPLDPLFVATKNLILDLIVSNDGTDLKLNPAPQN